MENILQKDEANARALEQLKHELNTTNSDEDEDFSDVQMTEEIKPEIEEHELNYNLHDEKMDKDTILDLSHDLMLPQLSNSQLIPGPAKVKKEVKSKKEMEEEEREKMHLNQPTTKRKSSQTHFIFLPDKKRSQCKHCGRIISIAGGSSSNLARHIKSKHPELLLPANNKSAITSNTEHNSKDYLLTQIVDKQLVKVIAKGNHDLGIVEESEMRQLIAMVSNCPGYQLPTVKSLTENLIPEIYQCTKNHLQTKLAATCAISISTDCWISNTNHCYKAFICHFIDNDTVLHSAMLTCRSYNEKEAIPNLTTLVKDISAEFNINNKVVAITSHNSSVKFGEYKTIGCFANLIHFIVQQVVEQIKPALKSVNKISEYFNHDKHAKKILVQTQQELNLPVLECICGYSTWNSLYEMLERMIQLKTAVIHANAKLDSDLTIAEETWKIMEEILYILKPFYEITMEMSSEKVLLSKVIVFCNLIESFLQKYKPKIKCLQSAHLALIQGMQNQFGDIENNILYAECTILDPRFKVKGFKDQMACETILEVISNKLNTDIQAESRNNQNSFEDSKDESIWDDYDIEVLHSGSGFSELDIYLKEDYLDRRKDPLVWWQTRRQLYPHLYKYMLQRFCILATAVPSDRFFTIKGKLLNERRKLINSSKVPELAYLHNNL